MAQDLKGRASEPEERESPSPRTTIVGGRPPERAGEPPPVPTGIQRLLRLAAVDEGFRRELLARRGDAAGAAGIELTGVERDVLASIPEEQLERMAEMLPPPSPRRREFLRQTAATAVVLLGGVAFSATQTGCPIAAGGARPDMPPLPPEEEDAGEEPEASEPPVVTRGISPDLPPEK